jgi:hypothetical protein
MSKNLSFEDLKKVRYAKGTYPPKGRMYYIAKPPDSYSIENAIVAGLKNACSHMLTIPLPMFGVKGIRYMAGKMSSWESKLGPKKASLYLGQVIRMLEEIGTGGAGFRFMYAAFLQESADIVHKNELVDISQRMTETGDKWREFAVLAARNFKTEESQMAHLQNWQFY